MHCVSMHHSSTWSRIVKVLIGCSNVLVYMLVISCQMRVVMNISIDVMMSARSSPSLDGLTVYIHWNIKIRASSV